MEHEISSNRLEIHYTLIPEPKDRYIGSQDQYHCPCCRSTRTRRDTPRRYQYHLLTEVTKFSTNPEPSILVLVFCAESIEQIFEPNSCERCNTLNQNLECITEFGREMKAYHRKNEVCPLKTLQQKKAVTK